MVRQIQHSNRAITTLNGALTDSATSVVVTDGSVFPAEGDYTIAVGNEVMRVTARSTNTLTVVRGVEGTGGQTHSSGDYVFTISTAESLNKWNEDAIAEPFRDRTFNNRLYDINGNVITSSTFTQGNWDGSSVTDNTWGSITIFADVEATLELRTLYKTAPATPYTITAHVQVCAGAGTGIADTTAMCGIAFRRNTGGRMEVYGFRNEDGFSHWQFDTWSVFSASVNKISGTHHRTHGWLRMRDDGTNLTSWCSINGYHWVQISQVGRTTFMGGAPDQVCFWAHNGLSGAGLPDRPGTLLAWHEE